MESRLSRIMSAPMVLGMLAAVAVSLGLFLRPTTSAYKAKAQPAEPRSGVLSSWTIAGTTNREDRLITLWVVDAHGNEVEVMGVEPRADGTVHFELLDIPHGSYTLYATADNALRKKVSEGASTSRDIIGLDFDLRLGDLDHDNKVSPDEIAFITRSLGKSTSTTTAEAPFDIMEADFDGDGKITAHDLGLAAPNINTYGD